ncbi:MAG: type IV conjugative transfer system protein TraE [Proteobacteria bacterium]|nr:type IV conjugative transfer system protein TraE [Pseudomonadota bacterium]
MNIKLYTKQSSNLFAENRLLKFVVVILTIGVVWSMVSANRALKYQRTIILPPKVDHRIEISGNAVNDDYLKMYTRYILELLLNYTPKTVQFNFNDLLSLVSPELYQELQSNLFKIVDNVEKLRITSVFYPSNIIIDQEKKYITIRGRRKQFSHFAKIEESERNYYLRYEITNGRFFLTNIQEQEIIDENTDESNDH